MAAKFPYLIPYIISLLTSIVILVYTWRRRAVYPAAYYGLTILLAGLNTVAYMIEISSDVLRVKLFWDNVQWVLLSGEAISLLYFALHFTERPPRRPFRLLLLLGSIPAVLILLAFTNDIHGLVHVDPAVLPGEPFSALTYSFTPIIYLLSANLLIMGLVVIGLLTARMFQVESVYRGQAATILLGVMLPTAAGLLVTFGVSLSFQRDITPIAFAISNVIVAYGLFHYRLFDLAPVARETILETMGEGVIVVDRYGRLVDVNLAAYRIIGRERGSIIGRHAADVFGDRLDLLERYRNIQEPIKDEVEVGQGDSRQIYALSISPIRARGKFQIGLVVVVRDVTERRKAAEALLQQTKELEIARAEAEQADRTKSLFLASVSHELRTPLNAIINFTQFVSTGYYGPANEQQIDALNKVTESSRHLLRLINDILDMSKIEAGRLQLLIEEDIQLANELDKIYEVGEMLIRAKAVKLIKTYDENLPLIKGDRRRIHQILLNLISNAAKFTDEGCIRLRAWQEKDHIIVAVEDSGPGIAPAEQALIFEPFQQLDRSSWMAGTGLGLPISKRLAEAHGGRLWLESVPGSGSTFFVSFPTINSIGSITAYDAEELPLPVRGG